MKISATALLLAAILAYMPSLRSGSAGEPNESEPVTAKAGYAQAYPAARKIASDAVLVRLLPNTVNGFTFKDGRAGLWEATFASPSKHECWTVSYAIATHIPDASMGVSVSAAIPWSGCVDKDVKFIPESDFRIDSDVAYNIAVAHYLTWRKEHPERNLTAFQLSKNPPFAAPTWQVIWGGKGLEYLVVVNATDGGVLSERTLGS